MKSASNSKSPRSKSSEPSNADISPWYQILIDLYFWRPTDRILETYWLCLAALIIVVLAAFSIAVELNDFKFPDFYFLLMIVMVHIVDIGANFRNEMKGNGHLTVLLLFTESAMNLTEIYLVLFVFDQSSAVVLFAVAAFTGNVLLRNIKYRDDDKISVRVLSYALLLACFAWNYDGFYKDVRLAIYAANVCVAMLIDLCDFPDRYFDALTVCEGLVVFTRSVAVYCLITFYLLWQAGDANALHTKAESNALSFLQAHMR